MLHEIPCLPVILVEAIGNLDTMCFLSQLMVCKQNRCNSKNRILRNAFSDLNSYQLLKYKIVKLVPQNTSLHDLLCRILDNEYDSLLIMNIATSDLYIQAHNWFLFVDSMGIFPSLADSLPIIKLIWLYQLGSLGNLFNLAQVLIVTSSDWSGRYIKAMKQHSEYDELCQVLQQTTLEGVTKVIGLRCKYGNIGVTLEPLFTMSRLGGWCGGWGSFVSSPNVKCKYDKQGGYLRSEH